MKTTLYFRVNGVDHTEEFDSASDAIDTGLNQLLYDKATPIKVIFNGRELATQDDFFILWEEALRSRASTLSHD